MSARVFMALMCGFAILGQIHAQEVEVAHETKTDVSRQRNPESAAATRTKTKNREKKSASAALTLEQMRMAGALAAERLRNGALRQTKTARESTPQSANTETPKPFVATKSATKEKRIKQQATPRSSNSRTMKPGAIVPVRPTMIESGKQERANSSSAKPEAADDQTSAPQSANRSPRTQETI